MYRISANKRKFSTTPVVRVKTDEQGREKEIQVLFSCLPKNEGDVLMENIIEVLNNKNQEHINWLDNRILELQKEYDEVQTASYGTGLDYDSNAKQKLISKGGKLKGYKEIRDYLQTH